jgi:hypothetical protein
MAEGDKLKISISSKLPRLIGTIPNFAKETDA